jgi:hypothetical protein
VFSAQNCFRLLALLLGKRRGTRCVGGLVGPRSGLDGCGKSLVPRRVSISGP